MRWFADIRNPLINVRDECRLRNFPISCKYKQARPPLNRTDRSSKMRPAASVGPPACGFRPSLPAPADKKPDGRTRSLESPCNQVPFIADHCDPHRIVHNLTECMSALFVFG